MRSERPSTDGGVESAYGDPDTDGPRDERELYGEPRHEAEASGDEQRLYGEPQHEHAERELSDVELLFARLRTESTDGLTVSSTRATASEPASTER